MAKKRIVHYLNQFYGGIGGEDMAHVGPSVEEKPVGPGAALQASFGQDAEIVATIICGGFALCTVVLFLQGNGVLPHPLF